MTKKKSKGFDLKPYLIGISIILTVLIIIAYKLYASNKTVVPWSVYALLLGLIYEYKRLSPHWKIVLYTILFSYTFSFLAFLPEKSETIYILENHLKIWPYIFCFIFIILAIAFYEKELIPKLTEGITLLQSVAVIYWVVDLGFIHSVYIFVKVLMAIGLCLALFSIYNAFSYKVLTKTTRFILSIWSCIIMVLFAVDNIIKVYQNPEIETTSNVIQAIYIALQFFLLGVCSIYIVQNLLMILRFLPANGTLFNGEYKKDLKKLKQEHISRYSTEQVSKLQSLFCLISTGIIFSLNYYYHFVPGNFLIWLFFVIFPIIVSLIAIVKNYIITKAKSVS